MNKVTHSYEDDGDEIFESPENMDTEDIRDMVLGYVKCADRLKLAEMLTVCRDLFFDYD